MVISCVLVVYSLFFLGNVFEGVDGRGANRWLNGHATFYGANQSPATLGKLIILPFLAITSTTFISK